MSYIGGCLYYTSEKRTLALDTSVHIWVRATQVCQEEDEEVKSVRPVDPIELYCAELHAENHH